MDDTGICCVADRGRYLQGIVRLHYSLNEHGFKGDRFLWQAQLPPNSPTHEEAPYGFKARAMDYARQAGCKYAVWADASCVAVRPLDLMFEKLSERAILGYNSGWALGQWCTDRVLPILDFTREESMKIPMIAATSYGLNFEYEEAHYVVDTMLYYEKAGALAGPWRREHGFVSDDPRVLGHRHDQTCLSAIFHRLNVELLSPPNLFSLSVKSMNDTTCLMAKGI